MLHVAIAWMLTLAPTLLVTSARPTKHPVARSSADPAAQTRAAAVGLAHSAGAPAAAPPVGNGRHPSTTRVTNGSTAASSP